MVVATRSRRFNFLVMLIDDGFHGFRKVLGEGFSFG